MKYRQVIKQIKKYNKIVIARHIGGDPDAYGSSIGLKEIILANFPNKEVYVVGSPSARFKYFGDMDSINSNLENALLIITDTPDKKRVDGVNAESFKYRIKIDHHPFVEKYCDLEVIDDTASSASQMIIELALECKLKIPYTAAEKLFMGVVSDTGRFMYNYTTSKTFELMFKLIKETNLDFTKLYSRLYLRSYNDYKFNAYIISNLVITENKLAYLKITNDVLKEYNVDASTAGNLIETFNNIEDILVIILCSEDATNNQIKCSIRSRGPVVNEAALKFNGGGHALASGARPKNFEEADALIAALDEVCKNYLN